MSVALFRERLKRSRLPANDVQCMPRWLEEFARTHPESNGLIPLSDPADPDVLTFLRTLRDRKIPCWQRLQAARTLEWYQMLVLRNSLVDFSHYKLKPQEMAEKERRSKLPADHPLQDVEGMDGEGRPGVIDPREPKPVQALRARMRMPHHPISIENAFASWITKK